MVPSDRFLVSETDTALVRHFYLPQRTRCPFHGHVHSCFSSTQTGGRVRNCSSDGRIREIEHFARGTRQFQCVPANTCCIRPKASAEPISCSRPSGSWTARMRTLQSRRSETRASGNRKQGAGLAKRPGTQVAEGSEQYLGLVPGAFRIINVLHDCRRGLEGGPRARAQQPAGRTGCASRSVLCKPPASFAAVFCGTNKTQFRVDNTAIYARLGSGFGRN